MKHKLVRYKVKPGAVLKNRRPVEAVFDALQAESPKDVGYMVVEVQDGSFVHLKTDLAEEPFELGDLPAFQAFGRGIIDRCAEPPQSSEARIVGRYGVAAR